MTQIKKLFNPKTTFATSDMHFGHRGIIDYCNRPWGDCATMETALISNWNKVVPEDADVIDLGDLCWSANYDVIKGIVDQLNGRIWHVMGNHDYERKFSRKKIHDLFEGRVYDNLEIKIADEDDEHGRIKYFMSHYPHLFWQRGSVHLHGHLHTSPSMKGSEVAPFHPMRYDVGVDNNNYRPISFEEIKVIITKQMIYG